MLDVCGVVSDCINLLCLAQYSTSSNTANWSKKIFLH